MVAFAEIAIQRPSGVTRALRGALDVGNFIIVIEICQTEDRRDRRTGLRSSGDHRFGGLTTPSLKDDGRAVSRIRQGRGPADAASSSQHNGNTFAQISGLILLPTPPISLA